MFPVMEEFTMFILKLAQQKLKVYENKMLRKIFGPKMDKVTRE
jgi:hypothetical protein